MYSDINFILLGEIVHRSSGEMLNVYAQEKIFKPLDMTESRFLPPASWIPRIAPTEIDPDTGLPFRGVVHDPTSRYMGGVAGHAGLFTTADDLARYAQMWLNKGWVNAAQTGVRVQLFTPLTIHKFTEPGTPPDQPVIRALGWDMDSTFSSNRGELYPIGSFGHTGFTGTSLWIDPSTNSYVILLTNVVHPHRGKSLSSLRSPGGDTGGRLLWRGRSGRDPYRLQRDPVEGRSASRGCAERRDPDRFGRARDQTIQTAAREAYRSHHESDRRGPKRQTKRGCNAQLRRKSNDPVFTRTRHRRRGRFRTSRTAKMQKQDCRLSAYISQNERRLTPDKMRNVDALVYDIQDVGARFYTYSCTMLYALQEAATGA